MYVCGAGEGEGEGEGKGEGKGEGEGGKGVRTCEHSNILISTIDLFLANLKTAANKKVSRDCYRITSQHDMTLPSEMRTLPSVPTNTLERRDLCSISMSHRNGPTNSIDAAICSETS